MQKPAPGEKSEAYREGYNKAGDWFDRISGFTAGLYHRFFPPQEDKPRQTEKPHSDTTLFFMGLVFLALGGGLLFVIMGQIYTDISGSRTTIGGFIWDAHSRLGFWDITAYALLTPAGLVLFLLGALFLYGTFVSVRRG